jgi:hypothetical protein
MTDIDAAFKHKSLDLTEGQLLADVHHHRQADDLGQTVAITERIFHPPRLKNGLVCLKPFCSDTAHPSLIVLWNTCI